MPLLSIHNNVEKLHQIAHCKHNYISNSYIETLLSQLFLAVMKLYNYTKVCKLFLWMNTWINCLLNGFQFKRVLLLSLYPKHLAIWGWGSACVCIDVVECMIECSKSECWHCISELSLRFDMSCCSINVCSCDVFSKILFGEETAS